MSMGPDDRQRTIERAGEALSHGGAVVLPTDTLYGVFVRAAPEPAELLDRLTGTPASDPEPRFTLHLADRALLDEHLALPSPVARRLVDRLLPGAARLLITQPEPALAALCAALGIERGLVDNGKAVALRLPDHPITRAVIRASGHPTLARALGASVWGTAGDPGTDLEHTGPLGDPGGGVEAPAEVIDDGPTLHARASTTVVIEPGGRFEVRPGGPVREEEVLEMLNTHILFVCTGNTCRSPMAEAIGAGLVRSMPPGGITISVSSAGVSAGDGQAAAPEAVEVMKERGLDLSGHRSRPLSPGLIDSADVILTMTPSHAQAVMQMAPASVHKVFTLDPSHPVIDPIGGPIEVYREVADQLEALVRTRLEEMHR